MMIETTLDDLDLTSEVRQALRDFAAALVETPQFARFERAAESLQGDEEAQRALAAYQSKQQSLQMILMLNAASEEEQAELENLREAVYSRLTVTEYIDAQDDLMALCRTVNDELSNRIGLRFAMRRGGCCG